MEPEKFVGNKSGSVDANDSFWTEEEMIAVDNELAEAAGHHELGGDSDDDEEGGGGGGKME